MEENKFNKVVGNTFEELNAEDMQNTQGAGDVDPEVVSNCLTIVSPSVIATNPPILSISIARNN